MSVHGMHFRGMIPGAWEQGVITAAFASTRYPAQDGEGISQHSILTIINHTIQCTNTDTDTDDAGNA